MSNTNLSQTQTEVKTDLNNRFQIVRDGESFALVTQLASESKIEVTRFRHHGPRKNRQELVITPQYNREDVNKEVAQRIFNQMLKLGRLTPEGIGNTSGSYWTLTVPSTAQALAGKGAASRPDLAERMEKAADLVDSGSVKLLSDEQAAVGDYLIDASSCTCKDFEFRAPDGWCKHRLAVRMARATGQAIEGKSDAEKEAAARDRVAADKAATAKRVYDGRRKLDQEWKQARRDGDGARRWMLSHMAHNGNAPIPAEIYRRATGYGREDELAKAKAAALATTPEQHLQRYDEMIASQQRQAAQGA